MKRTSHYVWLLSITGFLLSQCGAYQMEPLSPLASNTSSTAAQLAPAATTAAQQVEDVFGNQPTPQPTQPLTPPAQLQLLLVAADAELQAAKRSQTIEEARQHGQVALNLLVGPWGRWHDRTASSTAPAASTTAAQGVLPPYRTPTRANGDNTAFPIGAALAALSAADAPAQQAIQRDILGDTDLWSARPRDGYDAIAQAVAAAASRSTSIPKLKGGVPQAVAWAHLLVSTAHTLDQAQLYAQTGSAALQPAIRTAGQL